MVGVRRLLVAVVFLALLGAGVGYGLGALSKHQRAVAAAAQEQTGGGTGGSPRCPDFVEAVAGISPLYRLLYVSGEGREAWICEDVHGNLYYQGHNGDPGTQLIEGSNAIFLANVEREGANGYVAKNPDQHGGVTAYHVTPTMLRIEYPSGGGETHHVSE